MSMDHSVALYQGMQYSFTNVQSSQQLRACRYEVRPRIRCLALLMHC